MMPCGRGVAERSYTCLLPPLAAQRACILPVSSAPRSPHPPTLPALVLGTPMHRTASHFLGLPGARPCPSSHGRLAAAAALSSPAAAAPGPLPAWPQPTFSCNLIESHLVSLSFGLRSLLLYWAPAGRHRVCRRRPCSRPCSRTFSFWPRRTARSLSFDATLSARCCKHPFVRQCWERGEMTQVASLPHAAPRALPWRFGS